MTLDGFVVLAVGLMTAFVGYQAGVRQDRRRWYRERRAELYVDVLVEAYAEEQWCLNALTRRELAQIGASEHGDDGLDALAASDAQRLEPQERARLGARMAAYGSQEVVKLFGALGRGVAFPTLDGRFAQTWDVEQAFDALEAQIRKELGDPTHLEHSAR